MKKIFWRLHFLLFESWGKNISVVLYTLIPFIRKDIYWRDRFLSERGFLSIDKQKNEIVVSDLRILYSGRAPIADVISILLSKDPFIKRNFIKNSALVIEGPYEEAGVLLNEGDHVVDIGANIGLFSVFAGKKVGEGGMIYSFEPIQKTSDVLRENLNRNNIRNFQIFKNALGSIEKEEYFSVNEETLGDSRRGESKELTKEKVIQKRLDDVVREQNINRVDFIKADIEGMEREMLRGAKETITKFKPKLAICIYHLKDDPEVIEGIVKEYVPGYKIFKTKTKLFAWYE